MTNDSATNTIDDAKSRRAALAKEGGGQIPPDRSTLPPGLEELRHDAVRLGWQERRAFAELNEAIEGCAPAREAARRWQAVRARRLEVEAQIAGMEVPRG